MAMYSFTDRPIERELETLAKHRFKSVSTAIKSNTAKRNREHKSAARFV